MNKYLSLRYSVLLLFLIIAVFLIDPLGVISQVRMRSSRLNSKALNITSVNPLKLVLQKGSAGEEININGRNLKRVKYIMIVDKGLQVNGVSIMVLSVSDTIIKIKLSALNHAKIGGPYQLLLSDVYTRARIKVPLSKFSISVKAASSNIRKGIAGRNQSFEQRQTINQTNVLKPTTRFSLNQSKILKWSDIISLWDLFKSSFTIYLNNWNRKGPKESDTSYLYFYGRKYRIDIPVIQFEKKILGLKFKFLVNSIRTVRNKSVITRQGCKTNQLKMIVEFESEGTEIKGYGKILPTSTLITGILPDKNWHDNRGPDFSVNSGRVVVTLSFYSYKGNLNLNVTSNFTANINAKSRIVKTVLDTFKSNWRSIMVKSINQNVAANINKSSGKSLLSGKIMAWIKTMIPPNSAITDIKFNSDRIIVYYK